MAIGEKERAEIPSVRCVRCLACSFACCRMGCLAVAVSDMARLKPAEEPVVGPTRQIRRVKPPVAVRLAPMVRTPLCHQTHPSQASGHARKAPSIRDGCQDPGYWGPSIGRPAKVRVCSV